MRMRDFRQSWGMEVCANTSRLAFSSMLGRTGGLETWNPLAPSTRSSSARGKGKGEINYAGAGMEPPGPQHQIQFCEGKGERGKGKFMMWGAGMEPPGPQHRHQIQFCEGKLMMWGPEWNPLAPSTRSSSVRGKGEIGPEWNPPPDPVL